MYGFYLTATLVALAMTFELCAIAWWRCALFQGG
jgi:hypothetical protein